MVLTGARGVFAVGINHPQEPFDHVAALRQRTAHATACVRHGKQHQMVPISVLLNAAGYVKIAVDRSIS